VGGPRCKEIDDNVCENRDFSGASSVGEVEM
jgi:hypothetical protein